MKIDRSIEITENDNPINEIIEGFNEKLSFNINISADDIIPKTTHSFPRLVFANNQAFLELIERLLLNPQCSLIISGGLIKKVPPKIIIITGTKKSM